LGSKVESPHLLRYRQLVHMNTGGGSSSIIMRFEIDVTEPEQVAVVQHSIMKLSPSNSVDCSKLNALQCVARGTRVCIMDDQTQACSQGQSEGAGRLEAALQRELLAAGATLSAAEGGSSPPMIWVQEVTPAVLSLSSSSSSSASRSNSGKNDLIDKIHNWGAKCDGFCWAVFAAGGLLVLGFLCMCGCCRPCKAVTEPSSPGIRSPSLSTTGASCADTMRLPIPLAIAVTEQDRLSIPEDERDAPIPMGLPIESPSARPSQQRDSGADATGRVPAFLPTAVAATSPATRMSSIQQQLELAQREALLHPTSGGGPPLALAGSRDRDHINSA
jgi:hypothetical protein